MIASRTTFANATPLDSRKSDKELAARDVQSAISTCTYFPVRGLKCEVRGGALIVTGRLPTFYLKQVAITLVACHLLDDAQFEDEITVD